MDNVLRYAKLMFLCLGILTLTSCEPDDEATFDDLVRYGWAGDLGFSDKYGEPLQSGLVLDRDGFGVDDQCYFDDLNHVAFSL